MPDEEVVIAGAGAAVLSVAALLGKAGIPSRLLERGDQLASSWRGRYDSLYLNTARINATLPVYRIPRRLGRYPKRDDVVEYVEEYARRTGANISLGVEAKRIERDGKGWRIATSDGEIGARCLVVATGMDAEPRIPDWPGRESFTGELSHAADYMQPGSFEGRDVLVVGPSTSGSEIAHELATNGAGRVRVSMRAVPYIAKRDWPPGYPLNTSAVTLDLLPDRVADAIALAMQRVMIGNLSKYGMRYPKVGPQTRAKKLHQGPLVDDGFVDSLKRGRIEIVAAVESFEGGDVVLADGKRLQPDAVIAATGYRRGLEPLVGHLGVLDEDGMPRLRATAGKSHPEAPRLYFNGYYGTISGGLRYMRIQARQIARAIARDRSG